VNRHGYASTKPGQRTPEYAAWDSAKQRCTNPNHPRWKDYGGRGITMCEAWRTDFLVFLRDVGPKPVGYTLDRIDNDRGYEPGNVRWTDWKTQENNKRRFGNQWTGKVA
jgi:hypothetical protein